MLMSSTQYSPSEALKYSNFPEVYQLADDISNLQKSLEPIMASVSDFDLGVADAIYVNISEVRRVRDLSFDITDVLGAASNVCYDILLPLRAIQEALNELIFSFQYEDVPVVLDKQSTDLKRLNNVVNVKGEVIE